MTQVFVFSENDTFQVLTYSMRPEDIVRTVNSGDWQSILGFNPSLDHAFEALRVGKMVIIYPPVPPEDYPKLYLSPKEIQMLQALCSGQTADEAAFNLRVSVRTIRKRTSILRLKLNAKTIPELLAKATALGIVKPDLDSILD
ncbi:MAG TPA: LuxR C-terminal-related transcriptional regulator [Anaerolineaceae bacterium]|jgi:DNA-binding CsgD family transcriptional regulator|nr:LuxR C-terminal-related transcriptional regulator [Anaerolineaceae bacterium]